MQMLLLSSNCADCVGMAVLDVQLGFLVDHALAEHLDFEFEVWVSLVFEHCGVQLSVLPSFVDFRHT